MNKSEPEFWNIYWRLKSRIFGQSCLFKGHSQWLQIFGCVLRLFLLTVWKNWKLDKMTLHLHFTLKISVDLFGALNSHFQPNRHLKIFKNSGSVLSLVLACCTASLPSLQVQPMGSKYFYYRRTPKDGLYITIVPNWWPTESFSVWNVRVLFWDVIAVIIHIQRNLM
jgi:hypothetical protein